MGSNSAPQPTSTSGPTGARQFSRSSSASVPKLWLSVANDQPILQCKGAIERGVPNRDVRLRGAVSLLRSDLTFEIAREERDAAVHQAYCRPDPGSRQALVGLANAETDRAPVAA